MNKRICVDLNGVLDTYHGWQGEVSWHPPRPGAREFLRALRDLGFEIVVLTTRDPKLARAWLEQYDLAVLVDDVTDRKVSAHAYVDDRAVCFRGSFDHTLAELGTFAPYWQQTRDA